MNKVKDKCFAEVDGGCRVLKEKQCAKCKFYRSKSEYKKLKEKYPAMKK